MAQRTEIDTCLEDLTNPIGERRPYMKQGVKQENGELFSIGAYWGKY